MAAAFPSPSSPSRQSSQSSNYCQGASSQVLASGAATDGSCQDGVQRPWFPGKVGAQEGEGLFHSPSVLAADLSAAFQHGHWEHPDTCAHRLVLPGELLCPHLPYFRAALPRAAPDTNSTTASALEGTPSSVSNGYIVLIGKPGARWGEGRGQAVLPWDEKTRLLSALVWASVLGT